MGYVTGKVRYKRKLKIKKDVDEDRDWRVTHRSQKTVMSYIGNKKMIECSWERPTEGA